MRGSPVVAGKYQLLRQLGAGGMAEVYLARQVGLDGFEKLVVVKRILPSLSDNKDFITMFLDEARTAADLRHPNVVNIFEVGSEGGTYYMAMEYLHGQDIRSIQRKVAAGPKRIPLQHACQIALDAASGLYYAHQKTDLRGNPLRIIHRDVSPQNILVTYDGATKIVDFGIAKAVTQDAATATGIIKGKYTYMSPEQAAGEPIDPRSDQYALGIVFWEMLTMRRLFKRDSVSNTIRAIMDGDIPSPRVYAPDLPIALEQIVMRSLSSEPEQRFANCQDLVLALEDFLAREGIAHSPARLSQYLRDLFADALQEEAARGIDVVDAGVADAYRGAEKSKESTQQSRRGSGRSSSGGIVLPNEPGDPALHHAETALFDSESGAAVGLRRTALTASSSGSSSSIRFGAEAESRSAGKAEARRFLHPSALAVGAVILSLGAALAFWGTASPEVQLVVHSNPPGAHIYLDGQDSGESTPHVFMELAPGVHQVRLVLAGHADSTKELDVHGATKIEMAMDALERPSRRDGTEPLPAAPLDDGHRPGPTMPGRESIDPAPPGVEVPGREAAQAATDARGNARTTSSHRATQSRRDAAKGRKAYRSKSTTKNAR